MDIEKLISPYVKDMFPSFYQEEGSLFIQFVEEYYKWLEETGNVTSSSRSLLDNFDIDKSIDSFLEQFRKQYAPVFNFGPDVDQRLALRHAKEFFGSKGTEENIALFLKLFYGDDATVSRPSEKVLRASDGVWYEPEYLELSVSDKAATFVGKRIVGSRSKATAIVERVTRKTIKGINIDVAYISDVVGNFRTGELVTSDGLLDDSPSIVGSLSSIELTSGGKDFKVGDQVSVISSLSGKGGLARVSKVGSATGRVVFTLEEGGFGFTTDATVLVSDKVLNLSKKTPNPYQTVGITDLPSAFTVSTVIKGYNAENELVANGTVTSIRYTYNATSQTQTIRALVESGDFSDAEYITTQANTIVGLAGAVSGSSYKDFVPLETVVQPLQTVGVITLNGGFEVGNAVYGYYSNNTLAARGWVVGTPAPYDANSDSQSISVLLTSGSFAETNWITNPANTIIGLKDTFSNNYATGTVVGTTNTAVGVAQISGGAFTSNTPYAFVRGLLSNTYANVSSISTGSGAGFDVGRLTNTEEVFINTDRLGANNTGGVPYMDMLINGSQSNVGFVGDVVVVHSSNTTYPFINGGGTLYAEGIGSLEFTGGTPSTAAQGTFFAANGVLSSIAFVSAGLGYAVGDKLVFSGGTPKTVTVSTTQANVVVTVTSGGTAGLYTGLAVTGSNIPADTSIVAIDGSSLTLSQPATTTATGVVLTTTAAGYVATVGTSGEIKTIAITSPGTRYVTAPLITVDTTLGVGADVTAYIANGVLVDTTVSVLGTGYDVTPSVTATTTGIPATLQAQLDSGYGLPKDPNADLTTTIDNALTRNNFTIGTIASLDNISLGAQYNQDPFVLVIEPGIAGFGRRDVIVEHDNDRGLFIPGETVVQMFGNSQPLIAFTDSSPVGVSFALDEIVIQSASGSSIVKGSRVVDLEAANNIIATNGAGILPGYYVQSTHLPITQVISSNSTAIEVQFAPEMTAQDQLLTYTDGAIGRVDAIQGNTIRLKTVSGLFQSNSTPILGQTSGVSATVSLVGETEVISANRGVVKSSAANYVVISRRSFNLSFTEGVPIVGATSGTSANVVAVESDDSSRPIGFNAEVSADAGTVEGFIETVELVDSGFVYKNYEPIELKQANNPYVAVGLARTTRQGKGQGYFLSSRGFLNNKQNFLHDNDYWQDYSYDVHTGVSLDEYADILKQVCHVAGTKLFGTVSKVSTVAVNEKTADSSINLGDTVLQLAQGTYPTQYNAGEFLRVGTSTIGFANGAVQTEFTSNGFLNIQVGSVVVQPNNSAPTATGTVECVYYAGDKTRVLLSNVHGTFATTNTNATVESNTYVLTTNVASKSIGEVVYNFSNSIVQQLAVGNTGGYFTFSRNSTATFITASKNISNSAVNAIRPLYSGTSVSGVLLEPQRTNYLTYSRQLQDSSWDRTNVDVLGNAAVDPLGENLAAKLQVVVTGTSVTHGIQRSGLSFASSGDVYTLSGMFKKAEYNYGALTLPQSRFGANTTVIFDLTTGASQAVSGTPVDVQCIPLAGGWFRCAVSAVTTSTGTGTVYIHMAETGSSASFEGVGGSGVYATGVQLEQGYLSSYIPTIATTATRAADVLTVTAKGWSQLPRAAGVVTAKVDNQLIVNPLSYLPLKVSTNNFIVPRGLTVVQQLKGKVTAEGNVVFSNTSLLVVTNDEGAFNRYHGDIILPNGYILACVSNSTSTPNLLQVGEIITQAINSTANVTGVIITKNTSHVVVKNASGAFTPSTQRGKIIGTTSGANAFVSSVKIASMSLGALPSRTTAFTANGLLLGSSSQSESLSASAHNSTVGVDILTIRVDDAINKLRVSEFNKSKVSGSTLVGNTSGATATIIKTEII